jgi:hypothetical protein
VTAVHARDLHQGDVWHMHDWRLHVTAVDVQGNNVAVVTAEGWTLWHVPADELEEVDDR